ncbi:hypothetical protein Tco_0130298, partial [Tanacetum coccineum]
AEVVSDVGEHVLDTVLEHFDFMPCGATTFDKTCCGGEACHLDEQNPKCLEDWQNLDYQDLGWVDGNGSNPGGGFGKPRGGLETRGGRDGLEEPDGQLSMV